MSGEGDRASRPSSLQLDTPPPEREPLRFDVQLIGAPPEVEQLVNSIKQVAEDFLYHWKTFPIVLPPSRFTGPGNKPSDIIIPPPCDELDTAAMDAGIEPQPLSPKQLYSIRDKGNHDFSEDLNAAVEAAFLISIDIMLYIAGPRPTLFTSEFEVPSRHFPGQTHVWRVAGWLQRGRVRAREELYTHVARAAAVIVIVARDRLVRDEPVSVLAGATALLAGLHRLMDLIIGMSSMEARDLEKKIREERSRYLVAELICKPEHEEDISALAAWVTRAMRRAASEKADARELPRPIPRVPFLYTTPQRTQVDLRLYRRDVLRRAASTLQSILERESRGWFLHFRERHAAQLASQKMPLKDIEEEVRDAALREYVRRVCACVESSEPLAALGPDIPELLSAQLRAAAIADRAEESVRRRLEAGVAAAEARLSVAHPLLSHCGAWRRERVAACAHALREELRWAAREDVAHKLETHTLHMHRYFLLRDVAFLREREPLLSRELAGARSPTRAFSWRTRTWQPAAWRVTRHFRGRADPVPTVLTHRHTSIVTPRSDPSQPVYLLETDTIRETTTRWPGWRLANAYHRMWSWTWNLMFVLGVVVPWCSPLSVRTLIRATPFIPDYELSQVNGTLFPKRSSETHTMWSRLLALWRHVSKQRSRFETEPDSGLLGKGVSRAGHRLWQYGCVGALGSLGLLVLLPVACLLVSAASALLAVAAPLWAPPLALLAHAAMALLYDLDCPRPQQLNRWFPLLEVIVLRICLQGIVQPLIALVLALVVCPLCALVLLLGGVAWCNARSLWEAAAWRMVLARGARVPAHDSAFCKRRAGPAHPHPPPYQLTCAQAVAAACARAEAEALTEWCAACERAIERPLRDYKHFVDACFGPFSVQIAKTGSYKQLERECAALVLSLREKVSARRRELALPLSDAARARCRLLPRDLTAAVAACSAELARVWGGAAAGEEWWGRRGLEPQDYTALAANTLSEAFDPDILVPLCETSARLPLESGAGARAWEARCLRTVPPDLVAGAGWGAGGAPRVPPPSLDMQAFSPRARNAPPLPHPATVALLLHNRDSDNPIPLDSEICAEILKTLEDAPDSDEKRDTVERYRGGASTSASSSEAEDEDERPEVCRVERGGDAGACRWTLTGRGVRLRADLASPEDVTLDAERRGTSV